MGPLPMGLVSHGARAALLIAKGTMSPGTKPPANAAKPPNPGSELLPETPPLLELCPELNKYPGKPVSALPGHFFFLPIGQQVSLLDVVYATTWM
ncbi:hypothetical protein E4T56_gene2469 [Termitomyces sp. T112]|nr:hypothetical protein E4T56_gene2469 [Termitomyces sp. T112]